MVAKAIFRDISRQTALGHISWELGAFIRDLSSELLLDVWGGFWGILTAVLIFGMGILVGATLLRKGSIRLSSHRGRHRRRTESGWYDEKENQL